MVVAAAALLRVDGQPQVPAILYDAAPDTELNATPHSHPSQVIPTHPGQDVILGVVFSKELVNDVPVDGEGLEPQDQLHVNVAGGHVDDG